MNHTCLYSAAQTIIALWLVLIAHPAEGCRLSLTWEEAVHLCTLETGFHLPSVELARRLTKFLEMTVLSRSYYESDVTITAILRSLPHITAGKSWHRVCKKDVTLFLALTFPNANRFLGDR